MDNAALYYSFLEADTEVSALSISCHSLESGVGTWRVLHRCIRLTDQAKRLQFAQSLEWPYSAKVK